MRLVFEGELIHLSTAALGDDHRLPCAVRFEKIHPELAHQYAGRPGSSLPGQRYSLRTGAGFAGGLAAPGNSERGAASDFDVFGVAASAYYAPAFHSGD